MGAFSINLFVKDLATRWENPLAQFTDVRSSVGTDSHCTYLNRSNFRVSTL